MLFTADGAGEVPFLVAILADLTFGGVPKGSLLVATFTQLHCLDALVAEPSTVTDMGDIPFLVDDEVLITAGADLQMADTLIRTTRTPYVVLILRVPEDDAVLRRYDLVTATAQQLASSVTFCTGFQLKFNGGIKNSTHKCSLF